MNLNRLKLFNMNRIISIFTLILSIFIFSCDKVKYPIVQKATVVGSNFITKTNSSVSSTKKMLLEDYTGARCPNCPDAAKTATTLLVTYPTDLIVIAVHAGNFAKPFGNYINQDFRSVAGDTWNGVSAGFGIGSYPTGLINRKDYGTGLQIAHTNWSSVLNIAKTDPLVVKLDVTTKYDSTVKSLNVDVIASFKKVYSKNVMISVVLTEDGIKGLQDDQGVEIPEYDFEHMLRGAVNGDWGESLKTTPIAVNDTVKKSFSNFSLNGLVYTPTTKPIVVNDKNISVVVFAYDAITREVLQVEKIKIR